MDDLEDAVAVGSDVGIEGVLVVVVEEALVDAVVVGSRVAEGVLREDLPLVPQLMVHRVNMDPDD